MYRISPRYMSNEQLQVPYYIHMFGALHNLHMGPTEHNYIELSNEPVQRLDSNVVEII